MLFDLYTENSFFLVQSLNQLASKSSIIQSNSLIALRPCLNTGVKLVGYLFGNWTRDNTKETRQGQVGKDGGDEFVGCGFLHLQVLGNDSTNAHLGESLLVGGKGGDDVVDFAGEDSYGAENTDGIHDTHSWGGLDLSSTVLDGLLESIGVGLDDSKLLWIPFVGADVLSHLVDTVLDVGEGVSDSWEIELLHGTGNCWGGDCHGGKAEGDNGLELHLE
jgi:hypothetical protein